jgi:hypothetical protein
MEKFLFFLSNKREKYICIKIAKEDENEHRYSQNSID